MRVIRFYFSTGTTVSAIWRFHRRSSGMARASEWTLTGSALKRKPGALCNGAPFKDWNLPTSMTRLRELLAKHSDGDRQFVEFLSMVALYSLEAVTHACAAALEGEVVSSEYVVNRLHRAPRAAE